MKLDFIENLPARDYHADPCERPSLSSSIATEMLIHSPRHAWRLHPKLGKRTRKSTNSQKLGTVTHALLLGQEHLLERIEAKEYRSNADKTLRDDAAARGKIPVKAHEYDEALEHAARIDNALRREHGIVLGSMKRELTAIWSEHTDVPGQAPADVLCRARLDAFDGATIYDIKTAADASYNKLVRSTLSFGYNVQMAAYVSAVEHIEPSRAGRVTFVLLVIENETDEVVPVELDGTFRELGRQRWQEAVNAWHTCLSSGRWPGYATGGPLLLECPDYARMASDIEVSTLKGRVSRERRGY